MAARRQSSVTVQADGVTVSTDGPVEAQDAIQRDAFEVAIPEPTDEEAREAGRVIAWRGPGGAGAGLVRSLWPAWVIDACSIRAVRSGAGVGEAKAAPARIAVAG